MENPEKLPPLDPTTTFYEFLSYQECCYSLDVTPSITKFIRYNQYYKKYGSKPKSS